MSDVNQQGTWHDRMEPIRRARSVEFKGRTSGKNLNAPEYDFNYQHNGKRVYFAEDGRPYQLKSNGHRNYKFKGRGAFEVTIPSNAAPSPFFNKKGQLVYTNMRAVNFNEKGKLVFTDGPDLNIFEEGNGDVTSIKNFFAEQRLSKSEQDAYLKELKASKVRQVIQSNKPVNPVKGPTQNQPATPFGILKEQSLSGKNYDITKHALDQMVPLDREKDYDHFRNQRLKITKKILEEYDGYESYQYAKDVVSADEMEKIAKSRNGVYKDGKGYAYVNDDGSIERYKLTYNRNGEPVYALLNDDPSKNVYTQNLPDGKTRTYDVLTPDELHGKMYGSYKEGPDGKITANLGVDLTQTAIVNGTEKSISSEAIKDNFVLTDYGRQKAQEASKRMSQMAYHNFVIENFIEDLKVAKANNQKENILLHSEVQKAFGLNTDTVGSRQAFAAFQDFLSEGRSQGITTKQLFDHQMQNKKVFDNMLGTAYEVAREKGSSPAKREYYRWKNVRDHISAERTDLIRESNLKITGNNYDNSDLITAEEIERQAAIERNDGSLYEQSTKLLREQEADEKALANIKESVNKLGHSNEQAKRKIMNAVTRDLTEEGGVISKEKYDAMVHATNNANFNDIASNESKSNILKLVNLQRKAAGLDDLSELTPQEIKQYAGKIAKRELPDASKYEFVNYYASDLSLLRTGVFKSDEWVAGWGDLPEEARASFTEWSNRTAKVTNYNTTVDVLNTLGKAGWLNTYDEELANVNAVRQSMNAKRIADGDEPYEMLKNLKAHDYVKAKADEAAIKTWTDFKGDLEKNEQLYRLKGDMTLYNIQKVHDDGTVIAERATLPAKAFKVELNMAEALDTQATQEVLKKANDKFFTKEIEDNLKLTQQQWDTIKRGHAVHVKKFEAGKEIANAFISPESFEYSLLDKGIKLSDATGGRKMNLAVANQDLVDVAYSRAAWMLRSGEEDVMASNINMAMINAVEETIDKGGTINLAQGGKAFDQEFEDRFVKHLHQVYFDMNGRNSSAAEQLVLDVAKMASQYIDDVNSPDYQLRITAETHRLLSAEAGDIISKEFPYYKEALKPGFITDTITQRLGEIQSTSFDSYFQLEDKRSSGRPDMEYNRDDMDTYHIDQRGRDIDGKIYDAVNFDAEDLDDDSMKETINAAREASAQKVFVNEDTARAHASHLSKAFSELEQIGNTNPDKLAKKRFGFARDVFGNELVDEAISNRKNGKPVELPSQFEALSRYFTKKLVPEIQHEAAFEMIKEMMGQGYFAKGSQESDFYREAMEQLKSPSITSPDRLRSYVELAEAIPQLEMKVTADSSEIKRLAPHMADMVPDNEEFRVFTGKQGQLLARGNETNKVFEITGTRQGANGEEMIRRQTAFHATDSNPDRNARVSRTWIKDGTKVEAPEGRLPIAMNTPYNSNRITRHASEGFTSSSDIGTRAATQEVLNGKSFVGFDFETTGFLKSNWLMDRGLVLPTEAYYEEGSIKDGKLVSHGSRHLFMNLGIQKDVNGVSVQDIVDKELGTLNAHQFMHERSGVYGPVSWNTLTKEQKANVMGSEEISFLRNIAKYSDQADDSLRKNLIAHGSIPNNFSKAYEDLIDHAKIGLSQLSKGAGVAGATVVDDLAQFMSEHNEATNGKILLAQNGADADLAWARHFAKQSGDVRMGHQFFNGVDIDEQPKMIEMMHLSRLLNPSEKSHSLEAQVGRSNIDQSVKEAYAKGSHLADNDTRAMMHVFAEDYANKMTGDNIEWAKPGDTLVKVGSRGGNKIPHDVYSIMSEQADGLYNKEAGRFELQIGMLEQDGNLRIETIEAPTLQELQRNISQNYKGFSDLEKAHEFMDDITFDDAREDIRSANISYDAMVRERNRAQGNGTDVGLENLKRRYDELQSKQGPDFGQYPGDLSDTDKKVLQNAHLLDNYDEFVNPDYSDRQLRAMGQTSDYFDSADADMRMAFLGDVEDMKASGVIDAQQGRDLISQYNERIKQKAAAAGAGYQKKAVPGLVDLGTVKGDAFGSLSGTPLSVMANTYEQAEQGLWNIVNKFQPTTDPKLQHGEGWKPQAINNMMEYLKSEGIMPATAGNRMEDAVDAVMGRLQEKGPALVDDVTKPLIGGANTDKMFDIFEDAHASTLSEVHDLLAARPDLNDAYQNTRNMRLQMEEEGLAVSKMNHRMASRYDGQNLPLEGEFALRHADDIYDEIQNGNVSKEQNAALWKELYSRAQSDYSDASAAQGHMGWTASSDNYVHPYDIGDYTAGTKYSEMDISRGYKGQPSLVELISSWTDKDASGNETPSALGSRAGEYLNDVKFGRVPNPLNPPAPDIPTEGFDPLGDADDAAREAIKGNTYQNEWEWDRPEGTNRARSAIEDGISNANIKAREAGRAILDAIPGGGKTVGLVAAGIGAAFVARQWTRGDLGEERPEHDVSSGTEGGYNGDGLKDSSAPFQGTAPPSGGSTYLAEGQGGVAVQVHAKNKNGVSQEAIGNAVNGALAGQNPNVNVNHYDDTSSINSEWLQQKFSELLSRGYIN